MKRDGSTPANTGIAAKQLSAKNPSRLSVDRLHFVLERQCSNSAARAATFQTQHGAIQTPVFMPVATQATVKGQTVESLKHSGARLLLANTYHLLLRPGLEVFKRFGGIHRFMNWNGAVLTDSGGYQIFSLPHAREMNEAGARFQSYVDGKMVLLSPESSIEMQQAIGSDIMMVLDQCIASTAPYAQAEAAMALTHRWAERSLSARGDSSQALFGIVQGACHSELRKRSAAFMGSLPFDGLAIGGLAVGESHGERYDLTALVTEHLPAHLPRYLMGVGTPIDILECVQRGVDMFDCIIPSQLAQRGVVFTSHGKLQLRRSVYKLSEAPLDDACECQTCDNFSRAYLHHLIKSDEVLGWHLLGQHNLAFYHRLMAEMRAAILRDEFASYYEKQRVELARSDAEPRPANKPKAMRKTRMGNYEIHQSPQGFFSLRQISSGEVMHSVSAPSEEANRLYIEQSSLAARLTKSETAQDELVIWDVGLGAATNAMAAIHCFEKCFGSDGAGALRPMRVLSFESDLDALKLAAKHSGQFPHLWHPAPAAILAQGDWQHACGRLRWELFHGDFKNLIESAPPADLIFYDPFSYKTDVELWTRNIFARIFHHSSTKSTELYTYSASTAVRVALLSAGFYVAQGIGTGPKSETTIAFTRATGAANHPLTPPLLGQEWLKRWRQSSAKLPDALSAAEKTALAARIEKHPQFLIAAQT